jgi:hypothetical protein
MRAPAIGLQPDSGFDLLNGAGRFAAIGQQAPQSPGALRRGRASGALAASETPSGPDRFLANHSRYVGIPLETDHRSALNPITIPF